MQKLVAMDILYGNTDDNEGNVLILPSNHEPYKYRLVGIDTGRTLPTDWPTRDNFSDDVYFNTIPMQADLDPAIKTSILQLNVDSEIRRINEGLRQADKDPMSSTQEAMFRAQARLLQIGVQNNVSLTKIRRLAKTERTNQELWPQKVKDRIKEILNVETIAEKQILSEKEKNLSDLENKKREVEDNKKSIDPGDKELNEAYDVILNDLKDKIEALNHQIASYRKGKAREQFPTILHIVFEKAVEASGGKQPPNPDFYQKFDELVLKELKG